MISRKLFYSCELSEVFPFCFYERKKSISMCYICFYSRELSENFCSFYKIKNHPHVLYFIYNLYQIITTIIKNIKSYNIICFIYKKIVFKVNLR